MSVDTQEHAVTKISKRQGRVAEVKPNKVFTPVKVKGRDGLDITLNVPFNDSTGARQVEKVRFYVADGKLQSQPAA